jgi:hypothetical protein
VGVIEEFSPDPIPPTLYFSINPTYVSLSHGNTSLLTEEPTDSDTCVGSGAWTGYQGTAIYNAETLTFTTPGTYVYNLTCSGGGGSVSQSITVTVAK